MKIHLIKSAELDKELFTEVINLLQAEPGPIQFSYDTTAVINFKEDELFEKVIHKLSDFEMKDMFVNRLINYNLQSFPIVRNTASWQTLFGKCNDYRIENYIAEDEFVLLLTDIPNKSNCFASLDELMPFNGFIHTLDWDHYIECAPAFPIAYHVMALLLQKHQFANFDEMQNAIHERPIGCINDLCIQKNEVILKLRTADICRKCMERVKDKLSLPVIHHALKLMESLRVKMLYAQNFRQETPLSILLIDEQKRFFLSDFGNIEIKLRPLEKALYLLFIRHPEGIFLSCLSEHRQELYQVYETLSTIGMRVEMKTRIDDLVNVLNNSANEKMSRIKRVFENAIGNQLARNYYIHGAVGEAKNIDLERSLVKEV